MEIYSEDGRPGPTWHWNKFSFPSLLPEQEELEQFLGDVDQ